MRPGYSKRQSLAVLALMAGVAACAVNPATGERQLDLIGEGLEIQIGQAAHPDITGSMGVVEDGELTAYVNEIGLRLAATSERPGLPWSVTVLDDPLVNAFALPGGNLYVTRGILAHFESEAELAGVLGHEIGHVTARHGVSRISRTVLQQVALGVGQAVSEKVREYSQLVEVGLGLVNLSYSRDEETQSDELGLRYMARGGYDPGAMAGVFTMLASVSGPADERLPEWQMSHPYPESREEHIRRLAAAFPAEGDTTLGRQPFLDQLDGMVYGADPRAGYVQGSRFVHPAMAFEIEFPEGWSVENRRSVVAAGDPGEDGLITLQLEEGGGDPRAALNSFLATEGHERGTVSVVRQAGLTGVQATFTATGDGTEVRGEVLFIAHGGRLFRVLGASSPAGWASRRSEVAGALRSFRPVTDPRILAVQPWRIEVVRLPSDMTLRGFQQRYPSPASVEETARINRRDPDATIPAGTRLKRIAGAPLP